MPKVSIVVPVYNVEKYLRKCLDSILNQTLQDIEIICVDDGSTDNSGKILDEYAKRDNRIYVTHKKNSGAGSAYNVGLKAASGDYIGFVESDDYIAINMYQDLYNIAKENNVDVVKSNYYEISQYQNKSKTTKAELNYKKTIPELTKFKIQDYPEIFSFHPSIWSCLYNRDFLEKENIFFQEIEGAGWCDNLFQVVTLCRANSVIYTDSPYYYYRLYNNMVLKN